MLVLGVRMSVKYGSVGWGRGDSAFKLILALIRPREVLIALGSHQGGVEGLNLLETDRQVGRRRETGRQTDRERERERERGGERGGRGGEREGGKRERGGERDRGRERGGGGERERTREGGREREFILSPSHPRRVVSGRNKMYFYKYKF